jgi:hypothetical protein
MVEVNVQLDDKGKLNLSVGGEKVSPIVLVGLLEAAKALIMSSRPEEPKVVPVAGDDALRFARKVHS